MPMVRSKFNLRTGEMERSRLIEAADEARAQVRLADEYEQWRREIEGREPELVLAPGCRLIDGVVYYSAEWL